MSSPPELIQVSPTVSEEDIRDTDAPSRRSFADHPQRLRITQVYARYSNWLMATNRVETADIPCGSIAE